MKFLLDVCLGEYVENQIIIKNLSHDFKTIRSLNPKMLDREILKIAYEEDRIVITSDKDFGELVVKNKLLHKGVLLLHLDELLLDERIYTVTKIIFDYHNFLKNNFCVYQNNRLRIR